MDPGHRRRHSPAFRLGQLACDDRLTGTNYAAYFGVAVTVRNGDCVDIHQADRMQVVNAKGKPVSGRQSFEVGCSHAWTSRIVWDPRAKRFVMVCATDNNYRMARPDPYRTVAAGKCDGTLFGGDLVLAAGQGYWTAWSQGGRVRLAHFTTGKAVGQEFGLAVRDHDYQAFKSYPDGSAAYPAAGATAASIRIARLMPPGD